MSRAGRTPASNKVAVAALVALSIGFTTSAHGRSPAHHTRSRSFRAEAPEDEPTGKAPGADEGFWKIPGRESWIKPGGFVMLDLIHDFDAIGSEDDFVPSTIPVDGGTPSEGSEGRTTYSFRQTRFSLDSRTKAGTGLIRAYASVDFFGGTDEDPQLRLRYAAFRMEGLVGGGDLTLGQTTSYFMDTVAEPETLDYEGPAYSIFIRQPLVGWKRAFRTGDLLVSAEEPSTDVEGADGLTGRPDLVAAGRWGRDWGHLRVAGLARQLRASFDDGPVAEALGTGLSFSGQVISTKKKDSFAFQITIGDGIGRYIDDPPPDAVYDPATGDIDPLETVSGFVSYQHHWNTTLRTNVVYSALQVETLATQSGTDLEAAQYGALDLIWSPYEKLDLGIEVLYGTRRDRDGEEESATRVQLSGKYAF